MSEYYPWSNKELSNTVLEYQKGHLSIMDIELYIGACHCEQIVNECPCY